MPSLQPPRHDEDQPRHERRDHDHAHPPLHEPLEHEVALLLGVLATVSAPDVENGLESTTDEEIDSAMMSADGADRSRLAATARRAGSARRGCRWSTRTPTPRRRRSRSAAPANIAEPIAATCSPSQSIVPSVLQQADVGDDAADQQHGRPGDLGHRVLGRRGEISDSTSRDRRARRTRRRRRTPSATTISATCRSASAPCRGRAAAPPARPPPSPSRRPSAARRSPRLLLDAALEAAGRLGDLDARGASARARRT